jgi:ATP-binding cassette subfamily C protein CydD
MAFAAVQLVDGLLRGATMTRVSGWGILGVACAAARSVASVHVARWEIGIASRVGGSLRVEITDVLLRRGASSTEPALVGALVLAVRSVERATIAGVLGTARAWLLLSPLAVVLVVWLPPPVLLVATLFVPFAWGLSRLRGSVRRAARRALDRGASLDAHLDDLLRNLDLFRVHGTRAEVLGAMETLADDSARAASEAAGAGAFASALNEVVAAIAVLGFGIAVASGWISIDPTRAGPALAAAFLLYRPLRDLGDARAAAAGGEAALDVLEHARGRRTPDDDGALPSGEEQTSESWRSTPASLDLVGFGARDFGPRWTFSVPAGHLVAVTGPVGVGKTTLLRALLGLAPSTGDATVAGVSLEGRGVDARPFAWVPQDVPLVAGDLRRNLALGGPRVDEAVAVLASLAPTIDAALMGGRALSGGERALLAIARAVASGRPLLLLDEPTAHLDAAAEARVHALLAELRGPRTLLVVSHRATLLALADAVETAAPKSSSPEPLRFERSTFEPRGGGCPLETEDAAKEKRRDPFGPRRSAGLTSS